MTRAIDDARARRLAALDGLIVDLRIRSEHDEVRKVLVIRSRILRGVAPLKGARSTRYRMNVKPSGRARELPTLEPVG